MYLNPKLIPNHNQWTQKRIMTIWEQKQSSFETGQKNASSFETGTVAIRVPAYVPGPKLTPSHFWNWDIQQSQFQNWANSSWS